VPIFLILAAHNQALAVSAVSGNRADRLPDAVVGLTILFSALAHVMLWAICTGMIFATSAIWLSEFRLPMRGCFALTSMAHLPLILWAVVAWWFLRDAALRGEAHDVLRVVLAFSAWRPVAYCVAFALTAWGLHRRAQLQLGEAMLVTCAPPALLFLVLTSLAALYR
jgi:hypothetical protein